MATGGGDLTVGLVLRSITALLCIELDIGQAFSVHRLRSGTLDSGWNVHDMISARQLSDISSIQPLKQAYLRGLSAPIDGMWDQITDASPHWEIEIDGRRAGYYAADGNGTLLQFFISPEFREQERSCFAHVIARASVKRALVSTADGHLAALCGDRVADAVIHTYLYDLPPGTVAPYEQHDGAVLRPVVIDELAPTVRFQQSCVEGDQDISEWLTGYTTNLIEREELFCLELGGDWIGLGEFRRSDSQPVIVDLGVMVAPDHRGKGWATDILKRLTARCLEEGLHPICSTTAANVAAQRAIARAGFVSRHRLLEIWF